MAKPMDIHDELDRALTAHEQAIRAVADAFLRVTIIPACQKWGLRFRNHSGQYDFVAQDGQHVLEWATLSSGEIKRLVGYAEDLALEDEDHRLPAGYVDQMRELAADLARIYDVLDKDIFGGRTLGEFVREYAPKKAKR